MKKFILALLAILALPFAFSGEVEAKEDVLKIYNWEDYIDEGDEKTTALIDDWVEDYKKRTGKTVTVVYDTFATNEIMMNTLKTGKTSYDLVCPSEYTIMRMISQDMLETYDVNEGEYAKIANYNSYGSLYLKNLFKDMDLYQYAIPYMWGTLGMIYNPEKISEEAVNHWSVLWNTEYKKMATAKDSVRDTMVASAYHIYYDEAMSYRSSYLDGTMTAQQYNEKLTNLMNRTNDVTLDTMKSDLLALKKNVYGFEVDHGKNDIATGRISINVAWSGDAVYALDVAEEENGTYLNYIIPEEGSNVWFDGWVMPKGANKELAQDFVNYLCQPENAARNMNYIGYTPSIAGNAIWDLVNEWYGAEEGEEGYDVDLSYFFNGTIDEEYLTDGKAIITVGEVGRQFSAQYPTEEEIARCCVMQDFGDQNEKVLAMWKAVKAGETNMAAIIIVCSVVVAGVAGYLIYTKTKKSRRLKHRNK